MSAAFAVAVRHLPLCRAGSYQSPDHHAFSSLDVLAFHHTFQCIIARIEHGHLPTIIPFIESRTCQERSEPVLFLAITPEATVAGC